MPKKSLKNWRKNLNKPSLLLLKEKSNQNGSKLKDHKKDQEAEL